MSTPPAITKFERVAGSLPVEAAVTVVAALAGGPLAALLPVLAKSLASERQKQRVERYLAEVSVMLQNHEGALRNLTDAQYKLLNESILAALQTTQAEKLAILRKAVRRTLDITNIEPQEAILLSRILRDISAEEAMFVVDNFSYQRVYIAAPGSPSEDGILHVAQGSRDELLVNGLFSLGVLTPGRPTLGQTLRFSSITAKLILLLRDHDA